MHRLSLRPHIRIAGLYLVTAVGWILFTDSILADYQTLKGIGFVLASTLLIGVLIRHASQAQRRSERRFQAVIEHADEIITIIGPDGTRRYHSPALERVLGYRIDEVVGTGILDFVHPEDLPRSRAFFQQILQQPQGTSAKLELRVFDVDGAVRELSVTATNLLAEPSVGGIVLNTRDITERKEADRQIQQRVDQLAALHAIDVAILENHDLEPSLGVILEQVIAQLSVDAASLLLYDEETRQLSFAGGRGFRTTNPGQWHLDDFESQASRALKSHQPVIVPRLNEAEHAFARSDLIVNEAFVSYVAVPLISQGRPIGVLDLFSRSPLLPDDEWLELASTLAAQSAIAVRSAGIFAALQDAHSQLQLAYDRTLEGWAKALELRDDETEGHSQRVVTLMLQLARVLGIDEGEQVHMRRGALLHDIGKIGIPDSILNKPGPLDEEEWAIMQRHPEYAYDLLKQIPFLHSAIDIPYCHHERWDGTGYPRGLAGQQIPAAARVFSVVDVYDALTSDRPYRAAWSHERAMDYIAEQAGLQFDPQVCAAMQVLVATDACAATPTEALPPQVASRAG